MRLAQRKPSARRLRILLSVSQSEFKVSPLETEQPSSNCVVKRSQLFQLRGLSEVSVPRFQCKYTMWSSPSGSCYTGKLVKSSLRGRSQHLTAGVTNQWKDSVPFMTSPRVFLLITAAPLDLRSSSAHVEAHFKISTITIIKHADPLIFWSFLKLLRCFL